MLRSVFDQIMNVVVSLQGTPYLANCLRFPICFPLQRAVGVGQEVLTLNATQFIGRICLAADVLSQGKHPSCVGWELPRAFPPAELGYSSLVKLLFQSRSCKPVDIVTGV